MAFRTRTVADSRDQMCCESKADRSYQRICCVARKEFPGLPHLRTDLGFSFKVYRGLQEKLFGDGRQDQVRTGHWKPFK